MARASLRRPSVGPDTADQPASESERRLGERYILVERIGRGSGATVYAATDHRLRRAVTVKVFDPIVARDSALRARFQQQTTKAARLRHPSIAAVLDAGFAELEGEGERAFVVTEPAGPGTIRDLLERRGPLPPDQAVALTLQVADALAYAHQAGIIHADVKPENVLVDEGGRSASVVDFSLSFVSAATGMVTADTLARRAAYLAPEQVRGQPVSPATDVYGLGVLLYEMLVGRPPFVGPTPQATAERRVHEHARPAGAYQPTIPRALEALIDRALEREPQARWTGSAEMGEALARLGEADLRPVDLEQVAATAATAPPPRRASRRRPSRPRPYGALSKVLPWLAVAVALWVAVTYVAPNVSRVPRFSQAIQRTEVPGVVGLRVEEARRQAEARGLEFIVVGERVTERAPRGTVVLQTPVAGWQETLGNTQPLRVTVSAGVVVPDVRGKPQAEAETALRAAGWRVGRVERGPQPGQQRGAVALQHPAPGEVVEAPGEMRLVVAE